MTDPLLDHDDASTPLTHEERTDLIPTYITTKAELNEAEQVNIVEAELWAFSRNRDVLSERFLLNLHRRMLGGVWKWAGTYRRTERNIGVEPYRIETELAQLLDDVKYWIANDTFEPDEIAYRFHHKLVWIHAFPNGNGRHGRLATDLLLRTMGRDKFSWGRISLVDASKTRHQYVDAMRQGDRHDLMPLRDFVRS